LKFNIAGIYIRDNSIEIPIDTDLMTIFGEIINNDIEYEKEYFQLFDANSVLSSKFLDLDTYVVSTLLFNKFKNENLSKDEILLQPLFKIFTSRFGGTNGVSGYDMYIDSDNSIDSDRIINPLSNIQLFFKFANDLLKTTTLLSKSLTKLNHPDANNHETKEGMKVIAPDLAVVLTLDKDGNPIYDANQDGYIDIEDLKILGSNVDNPEDFDFEIRYGIWYKRFRPENMEDDRIKRISADLKIIYYLTEKNDMSELKDYLVLWQLNLVSDGFDIYDNEQKQKEIKALGYDLTKLDNKLLFFRLFVNAIKNIMVMERDYILYKVEDMNEESKRMLYKTDGLNTEAYNFNLMWLDIKKTQFFKDSLYAYTPWLDEQLPEVTEKINNL